LHPRPKWRSFPHVSVAIHTPSAARRPADPCTGSWICGSLHSPSPPHQPTNGASLRHQCAHSLRQQPLAHPQLFPGHPRPSFAVTLELQLRKSSTIHGIALLRLRTIAGEATSNRRRNAPPPQGFGSVNQVVPITSLDGCSSGGRFRAFASPPQLIAR
jgi:hypothetical protein